MMVHRHKVQGTCITTHRSRFAIRAGTLFNRNYSWYLNFTIKHALVYFIPKKDLRVSNIECWKVSPSCFLAFLPSQSVHSKRNASMGVESRKFHHAALVFHFIFSLFAVRRSLFGYAVIYSIVDACVCNISNCAERIMISVNECVRCVLYVLFDVFPPFTINRHSDLNKNVSCVCASSDHFSLCHKSRNKRRKK